MYVTIAQKAKGRFLFFFTPTDLLYIGEWCECECE